MASAKPAKSAGPERGAHVAFLRGINVGGKRSLCQPATNALMSAFSK